MRRYTGENVGKARHALPRSSRRSPGDQVRGVRAGDQRRDIVSSRWGEMGAQAQEQRGERREVEVSREATLQLVD